MQSLKPRCEGCGTPNAIDAIFCQECGVGLNIEIETASIAEIEAPMAYHEDRQGKCTHRTTVQNGQCECVRCIGCDKRTETCHKHTPKFDYGLQTKKENPLDHLRETLSSKTPTPFPIDKKLDFRSRQIPDWELPKRTQTIINQIEQAQTWPDKFVAKTTPPQKPEPTQIPVTAIGKMPNQWSFSKLEKLILIFSTLGIIISLGILNFM